ncbi:MAG: S-adenosylmethionine decarboxylase [Chitinophagaceae bacterium]
MKDSSTLPVPEVHTNMLHSHDELRLKNTELAFHKNESWGLSTAIDLHACNPAFIRSAEKIKEFTIQLCDLIKVKRFGECIVVHFGEHEQIAGYSLVQLIETSLVSGHFANLTNHAYIDIFSCKYYDPELAINFCKTFFEAENVQFNYILRK